VATNARTATNPRMARRYREAMAPIVLRTAAFDWLDGNVHA
jgi:hypothetical protein